MGLRSAVAPALLALLTVIAVGCARQTTSMPSPSLSVQAGAQVVDLVARDFEFSPRVVKVRAGTVRFQVTNRGAVDHDFAIPALAGHNEREQHLIKPGATQVVDLELRPGSYEAILHGPGPQRSRHGGNYRSQPVAAVARLPQSERADV